MSFVFDVNVSEAVSAASACAVENQSVAARVRVNNLNITVNGAAVYVNGVVTPLDAGVVEPSLATDVLAAAFDTTAYLAENSTGSEYVTALTRRDATLTETAIAESVQQAIGSPASGVSVNESCPATDHAISFADWHTACAEQAVASVISASWGLFNATISESASAWDSVLLLSGLLGARDADARLFVWTAPPTLRVLTATNQTVVFPGVNGVFSCRGNTATHVFTPRLGVVLED